MTLDLILLVLITVFAAYVYFVIGRDMFFPSKKSKKPWLIRKLNSIAEHTVGRRL